ILGAADTPMTTSELADACDIALSTAYRKVERLSETPLLVEGVRFDPEGDHAAEYSRGATDAAV
ncbi:helix-turn-helix domain-containing protein, partial [Halorubrum sp. Ea1]|uniref:helix-turn-helix domain-containing protein n=2 Tax=Halorubrum TaxID=56688 RepID=UPI0020CDDDD2